MTTYYAIVAAPDGCYEIIHEGDSIEECQTILENKGSAYIFYPYEFIMDDDNIIIDSPYPDIIGKNIEDAIASLQALEQEYNTINTTINILDYIEQCLEQDAINNIPIVKLIVNKFIGHFAVEGDKQGLQVVKNMLQECITSVDQELENLD